MTTDEPLFVYDECQERAIEKQQPQRLYRDNNLSVRLVRRFGLFWFRFSRQDFFD